MMEHKWSPDEVFVFGSNLLGIHGAGAAKFAREHCGAVEGVYEGRTGQSYALPTCTRPGLGMYIGDVAAAVQNFLVYAAHNPTTKFFLTRVGCGFAGYTDDEIAPLFRMAPANVRMPPGWERSSYRDSREHARNCPGLQAWDVVGTCTCGWPVVRRCIEGHQMKRKATTCKRCESLKMKHSSN